MVPTYLGGATQTGVAAGDCAPSLLESLDEELSDSLPGDPALVGWAEGCFGDASPTTVDAGGMTT